MDTRAFSTFGPSHWVALFVTASAAVALILLARSSVAESTKRATEIGLGMLLIASVLADPITTWFRYFPNASEIIRQNSYPFYLCDVVALILAMALFLRSQRLTEVGYLWGIAGTLQGLITPTLYFNWDSPEYYAFFLQHGGVPVAALMLVVGLRLTPKKGAFKRILIWSWAYIAVVIPLNWMLETNYGFLNGKPSVPTLFDFMGPYPWYLITMNLFAYILFALLLLPFMIIDKRKGPSA